MNLNYSQAIEEIKAGNLNNFGLVYDKFVSKIYRFFYYRTNNQNISQDLTSQTFLKAIKSLQNKKFTGDNFTAWLYKIAKNLLVDYYRQHRENLNIDDVWFLKDPKDLKEDLDYKFKINELKKHLEKLTYQQREILIMRVWDELSYKEIAKILNKTESNCKMSFSRAVKNLKKELPVYLLLCLLLNL